jgi:hypothetical protein
MSRNFSLILVLLALFVFLAAGIVLGGNMANGLGVEFTSACARIMEGVIRGGQGEVYNFDGVEEFVEPDVYNLALYSVEGDEIENPVYESVPAEWRDEQKNAALQYEAWRTFTELIPQEGRRMVAQFNVFTDGVDNTLAAVDFSGNDPTLWKLEVDITDLKDRDMFLFTLIHEYAHLLTLNDSQVEPDEEIAKDPYNTVLQNEKAFLCPNYFTGTGCSNPDSYIQSFYSRFWTGIEDEWEKADAIQYQAGANVKYYNALYDFYRSHHDQFVSDYSVTHPTEDIAEAFTHFVFSPKPHGNSIREEKIRFFYEYPELVRLRGDILSGACGK